MNSNYQLPFAVTVSTISGYEPRRYGSVHTQQSYQYMTEDARLLSVSHQPSDDLIAQLRTLAPEVFTESRVDFEKLKAALGEKIENGAERYGLNWAGKAEAFRNMQTPSVATLLPMPEESVDWDTTENLIIEGDNLEVLKLLQKPYHGQVKMIYIDPPYNTGNEFIYPDNFREGLADYLRYSGQVGDDGQKISTNTETSGRFHSNWLNMMYPRLLLARSLLREDGVIFVSIDDNEVHNLRMLMNEVFGEENFIGQISILSNPKGRVMGEHFARSHDYLLAYSKAELDEELSIEKTDDEIENQYTEKDDAGSFRLLELRNTHRQFGRFNRRLLFFPLYVQPEKGDVFLEKNEGSIEVLPVWDDGFEGCWTWGKDKARTDAKMLLGRYVNGRWKVYRKAYSTGKDGENTRKKLQTIWVNKEFHTEKGQAAFDSLIPGRLFQSPKPIGLIKTLLALCNDKDAIALDFFSGSGSTAQATIELNSEDGGRRKFILVQLPEKTGKPDYPTIAHITRERVRRVIAKLDPKENPGFRAFKLSSSNFKIWNADEATQRTSDNTAVLSEQLKLYADNVERTRSAKDKLYELVLKSGLPLSSQIAQIDIAGKTVWSVAADELLICLESPVTPELLQGMVALKPARMLCLDVAFVGNDSLKTNTLLDAKSQDVLFRTV